MLIGFLIAGFAALIVAGGTAAWFTGQSEELRKAVEHTHQVEAALSAFRIPTWRAEVAARGHLIVPDQTILGVYRASSREIRPALLKLERLTMDNGQQRRRIARLKQLYALIAAQQKAAIAATVNGTMTDQRRVDRIIHSVPLLIAFSNVATRMGEEEKRLLAIRTTRVQSSLVSFYVVLTIAGLLLLAVALLTVFTLLRYTSDLTRSRDRLRDLADGLEDSVRDRTADLSRANEEIQRFAYIVSHDLRAPLVNVLGFTSELETAANQISAFVDEVARDAPGIRVDEARTAARDDLPEAIGFIRTSAQKMDRLINAILKLSREGRRVITPEPIEMVPLIETIDATLRHRLDEAGAEIAIDPALPMIISDRLAIEQIMSNLIENAVKYLQPGRPGRIAVSGALRGSQAVFRITDNGRGIDSRDHQRIFDLFRRSGIQDQAGEGIGLAHVRALAYRLGGTIEVDSRFGEGSTFTLAVPHTLIGIREQ